MGKASSLAAASKPSWLMDLLPACMLTQQQPPSHQQATASGLTKRPPLLGLEHVQQQQATAMFRWQCGLPCLSTLP